MSPGTRALARLLPLALLVVALPARAQTPAARDSGAARADSTAPPPVRTPRASWLSDRLPLRVGDLVTVVVDEQTAATEHVSNVATGNRSQQADLNPNLSSDVAIGPSRSFGTGITSNSRDVGDAGRTAGFTAVITVRVTDIAPNGIARIAGTKKVNLDGRQQDVTLTGSIRTQDVDAHNQVRSDHIAEAVLTYKGKKLAPRTGILGGLLGIIWP